MESYISLAREGIVSHFRAPELREDPALSELAYELMGKATD
jgi:hypothetical protein